MRQPKQVTLFLNDWSGGNHAAFDKLFALVLRYLGALMLDETAKFLTISPDTVTRDWNSAKAFLYQRIGG